MTPDTRDHAAFIVAHTALVAPPHVPEIRLHLADEATELWHATEAELDELDLPPPYWAFAWAGGQALARYVLDDPWVVRNRRVLDFASGSGLVGIAAAMAGAKSVTSTDIDPIALAAIPLNAAANGVVLQASGEDMTRSEPGRFDVILAGDVFYEKPMSDRVLAWLEKELAVGTIVVVGDPGRSYLPKKRLEPVAEYSVPVTRALEDADIKLTRVWRFLPK